MNSQETLEWVHKVIRSCQTKEQLKTAYKLALNYYNLHVNVRKSREITTYMEFLSSPVVDLLKAKKESLK